MIKYILVLAIMTSCGIDPTAKPAEAGQATGTAQAAVVKTEVNFTPWTTEQFLAVRENCANATESRGVDFIIAVTYCSCAIEHIKSLYSYEYYINNEFAVSEKMKDDGVYLACSNNSKPATATEEAAAEEPEVKLLRVGISKQDTKSLLGNPETIEYGAGNTEIWEYTAEYGKFTVCGGYSYRCYVSFIDDALYSQEDIKAMYIDDDFNSEVE